MKLRFAVGVLAVVALAACGRPTEVRVRYIGATPTNVKAVDNRSVEFYCPSCGEKLKAGQYDKSCRKCGTRLGWDKDKPCDICRATGECQACRIMNQANGECYDCRGNGFKTMPGTGKTSQCQNCKGTKKCPICKGTRKCDFCGGSGKASFETLKSKVKAPAEAPVTEQ